MRSWHDYHLIGFTVDGAGRRITLEVFWPYETEMDIRRAQVTFSGLEGYFFEHDLGGNILYGVTEAPVDGFVRANASWFQEESKWGWPLFWRGDVQRTLDHLTAARARLFELSSSYGLSGWVLASGVEHHVREV